MTPTPTESSDVHLRSSVAAPQSQSGIDPPFKKMALNDLSGINDPQFVAHYESSFEPPNFTIKELRDCIPPHLFEKSMLKSSAYVAANVAACIAIFYLATLFDTHLPHALLYVAWPAYWWFEGISAMGCWVLAHECGHQTFSNSKTVNNAVGLVLHSILLVPYHSWRITHAQHHASTAHMGQDQVFVPNSRSEVRPDPDLKDGSQSAADKNAKIKKIQLLAAYQGLSEAIEDTPLYNIVVLAKVLGAAIFGWPLHLFIHATGQKYERQTNHFLPSSPVFEPRHRRDVLISDAGVIAMLAALGYAAYATSIWTVIKYYGIPYLFVNGWLVTITVLQHTDVYVPHYSPESWNFVRGALATVDRDYGWFLNHAWHHIQDSHVAHHLFSQMPHYNAIKATPYLKAKLGEYYLYDRTPLLQSVMRAVGKCLFVEDSGDILFYRNK